jgi:UPF0176 protein
MQSKSTESLTVWSFYCFVKIEAPEMLIPKLLLIAKKKLIKGTILLSTEGFNGSISANHQDAELLFAELLKLTSAKDVNLKINPCNFNAFSKLKIKIKKEIVSFGIKALDIHSLRGEYIKPGNWDDFISQDNVVLIDTRNDYEVQIGSFESAINPNIKNFRELPKWLEQNFDDLKDKKVAMFCTGGIRCEKSTSYLKLLGHNEVYQLDGGILQYFQDVQDNDPAKSSWKGGCFVFDDRKSVAIDLQDPR